MNSIAIDFGSSRTKAAWLNPSTKKPECLKLGSRGEEIIASLFYVPPGAAKPLVGDAARDYRDEDPAGIVRGLKKRIHEITPIRRNGRQIVPVDLAALIFEQIREFAEKQVFHAPVEGCVLTVPVVFDLTQRDALVEAARKGGFTIVETVEEPVAAARWWLISESPAAGEYVVVCDIGGGTTDIALLRKTSVGFETFSEIPPAGFAEGGNDVDDRIFELLSLEMGADIVAKEGCRVEVQETRERFARDTREEIPLRLDGQKVRLTRSQVESCGSVFLQKVCAEMRRFQERMSEQKIVAPLLLVGGGRHTLGLEEALRGVWTSAPVLVWKDSDYAIVLGGLACAQAAASKASTREAMLDLYREHLRFAFEDQIIEPQEYSALITKATKLDLSVEERERTEREILGMSLEQSRWVSTSKIKEQVQTSAVASFEAAKALLEQSNLADALTHSVAACDLEPKWVDSFLLKGRILARMERWGLAEVSFTRALELEPMSALAYTQRGWCRAERSEWDDAWNDFHYALEFQPNSQALVGRSRCYINKNLFAEALAELEKALEDAGKSRELREEGYSESFLHVLCAWLCRKVKRTSRFHIAEAWRNDVKTHFNSELFNKVTGEGDSLIIANLLNQWLWQAICEEFDGPNRESAAMFLGIGPPDPEESFWANNAEFCFYAASAMAGQGLVESAQLWLERLFNKYSHFDVLRAQSDQMISKHTKLLKLLTPVLSISEMHGAFFNYVGVTNLSPFAVHEVRVKVEWIIVEGKLRTEGHFAQTIEVLNSGGERKWENVFKNVGFLGHNVESVSTKAVCRETL
jgi:molecular chaperone DnaK (HSP70)